jgi:hypothetical protein
MKMHALACKGMSTEKSPQSVASAYFDAWKASDIERVRPLLHTDVDFVGALGKLTASRRRSAG